MTEPSQRISPRCDLKESALPAIQDPSGMIELSRLDWIQGGLFRVPNEIKDAQGSAAGANERRKDESKITFRAKNGSSAFPLSGVHESYTSV